MKNQATKGMAILISFLMVLALLIAFSGYSEASVAFHK
jgi:Na+-transporting methylmalonyl-CoA/oxaloacetate decarboxylase gamma subunit